MTTTTTTAFTQLQQHADTIRNDAPVDLIDQMEVGDAWAQGDLLIRRIARRPVKCVKIEAAAQLAPGTTRGSRHCLRSLADVTMYRVYAASPLEGPVFRTRHPVWIDHPEHGNVCVPAGVYAIEYQRAYADELRRVLD